MKFKILLTLLKKGDILFTGLRSGGVHVAVDYTNLWKLLIDKKMNKSQLKEAAHISTNAVAKLGKNETVSLETLEKICVALECRIEDIVDFR